MTLSSSLSNALSGLTAASRAAEIVSANVANAMTPGFARREISLSASTVGGAGAGVQVDGVVRMVDERAIADRRLAEASLANASSTASSWLQIETAIGLPTEDGSLESRLNAFESALISASSRPDQTVRLDTVVNAASDVASHLQSLSDDLQSMRMDADSSISNMVDQLNTDLEQVQTLNWQIFRMGNADQDVSSLMDQRQTLVDSISEVVPVHQVARDGGQVALFTSGGAILLDGPAAELEFTPTGMITPDMTLEAGSLSGLSLNGVPLSTAATYNPIGGGKLAAAFDVRDRIAPTTQTDLDALARNLVERFQDPALDTSLAAGDAGIFTDGTSAFSPVDEIGLASRIRVNPTIDLAIGGESWRVRDGINATASGSVGDASLLSAMSERMSELHPVASGSSAGVSKSMSDIASDLLSDVTLQHQSAETRQAFESARVETLTTEEMRNGVDTDDEMQKLLLIEQAYAANARVMQTLDDLMQQLLGM